MGFKFKVGLFCLGWRIRVWLRGLIRVFLGSVRFLEFGLKLVWNWIMVVGLYRPGGSSELKTYWIH